MEIDIDHIDPKWEEGRDYMTVCGLDVVFNMCERDRSLNQSKSNRFVPWRWSKDELGDVPVEPGDLCLFLEYGTNEWVLEEFMGPWWFETSLKYGYAATEKRFSHTDENKELFRELGRKRVITDDFREKMRVANTGKTLSEETKEKIRGYRHTEESLQKIGDSARRHMKRIWQQRRDQKKLRQMSINDPLMPDFDDL